jgi:hypothetical protein
MRSIVFATACALAAACTLPDPVNDRAVERLGPEGPEGPSALHRPGQPCTACHRYTMAGTVFAGPTSDVGAAGVRVVLVDALGTSPPATKPVVTNRAGNFWVTREEWEPVFPVKVTLVKGTSEVVMRSEIGRSASCATCHETAPSLTSPFTRDGRIWITESAGAGGPQ